jgi:hypothetical protein
MRRTPNDFIREGAENAEPPNKFDPRRVGLRRLCVRGRSHYLWPRAFRRLLVTAHLMHSVAACSLTLVRP